MRVLVLCGDKWHSSATARVGLAAREQVGFSFEWNEHAGPGVIERLADYPAVILTKSDHVSTTDLAPWLTDEVQAAFVEFVRCGGGLLAIHSGLTGYFELPVLRGLIGGAFVRHPEQCPVTVEPRAGHPLAEGVEPFTLVDEHYMMEMDDPQADFFLTAASEHGAQPAGWTRTHGQGRVCALTPGHNLEIWLHPSYQALIGNALNWCGAVRDDRSSRWPRV